MGFKNVRIDFIDIVSASNPNSKPESESVSLIGLLILANYYTPSVNSISETNFIKKFNFKQRRNAYGTLLLVFISWLLVESFNSFVVGQKSFLISSFYLG